jgi:competence protein ComEA
VSTRIQAWLVALCLALLSNSQTAGAQARVVRPSPSTSSAVSDGSSGVARVGVVTAPTTGPSGAAREPVAALGVVNINSATEEEFTRLPRIGPARAAAIITLRTRVGRFRSVDDLLRVRGIGRASLRALRPLVALTGETTLLTRPGGRSAQRVLTAP